MRLLSAFVIFAVVYCVYCKNNVKSLTESMGQEVIEIGTPVKELPPELEEEPSAEADDDDKPTAATSHPVTKKETKKPLSPVETRRKSKDQEAADDAKIEKELAEMYKDNADYKDTSDEPKAKTNATEKPVLRMGNMFKFQPEMNNKKEIEKFRTSMDDISCAKGVTKLDDRPRADTPLPNKSNESKKETSSKPSNNEAFSFTPGVLCTVSTLALIYTLS